MPNDLTAWNTERFQVSFDVSAWAAAYTLSAVAWRMQARTSAASPIVMLDIPAVGSAAYASGAVVFSAPTSAIANLVGSYDWDFGFTPPGGDFIRVDGGTLTINQGVTR